MAHSSRIQLLAIAAATALTLAACGGGGDDSSSSGGGGGAGSPGGTGSGNAYIPAAEEQTRIVNLHNDARAEVGVPNLAWSDTVANVALTYAQKLATQGCPMVHSSYEERNNYGENLASSSKAQGLGETGTTMWIAEKSSYTPGTPIPTNENDTSWKAWGHYTQVVWRDTSEVGCAYASCSARAVFVCHYNPTGNWRGEAPY